MMVMEAKESVELVGAESPGSGAGKVLPPTVCNHYLYMIEMIAIGSILGIEVKTMYSGWFPNPNDHHTGIVAMTMLLHMSTTLAMRIS